MKIYNKNEFSYVVSSITGFTDQSSAELVTKSLVGGTTASLANIKLGIKGVQTVNLMDSSPIFQSGDCGWNATGTTTLSQVSLTACPEKLNEALCPDDLYSTYQSLMLAPGQTEESVPFQDRIAELKVAQIQKHVEDKLWSSVAVSGDCFNGLSLLITSGTTGVDQVSGTAFDVTKTYGTAGNPLYEVDKLINGLSDDAMSRDDLIVWLSFANFRKYVQALTQANLYADYVKGANITSQMYAIHPNTNIRIQPTYGLNGSNKVCVGPAEYLVVGFDQMSDTERLDMWYSKDNDEVRIRANFNYAVNIVGFSDITYWVDNGLS